MKFRQGEILYFDKPYRMTSFKVVARVRAILCEKLNTKKKLFKVGHAGTLDPLATGVLIICTGRATKRIEELQSHSKEYVAELRLGATTPSFDKEHEVDATYPTSHITRELIEHTLQKFIGTIKQIPPSFSACKIEGQPAYKRARKGEDVKLKPKTLVIDEIELLECNIPDIKIRVVCSKGTYIRALARDIGEALQSGAYLTSLRRTRVGDVTVDQCLDPLQFEEWLEGQDVENEDEEIEKEQNNIEQQK